MSSRDEEPSGMGWGNEDRGSPMVVVAPAQDAEAAAVATTRSVASLLLVVVILAAMAIAAGAIGLLLYRINGPTGYEAQIHAEQEKLKEFRAIVQYRDELEEQNEQMTSDPAAPRPFPPAVPFAQQTIDTLRADNAKVRAENQEAVRRASAVKGTTRRPRDDRFPGSQ